MEDDEMWFELDWIDIAVIAIIFLMLIGLLYVGYIYTFQTSGIYNYTWVGGRLWGI